MRYQTKVIRLRHWRERRGLSVRVLARAAGVGYVSIVRIETGRMSPTVAMLEKLARALGVSVRDFFPVGWPGRVRQSGAKGTRTKR